MVKAQIDKVDNTIRSVYHHRKSMLYNLTKYIESNRSKGIVIVEDFNKSLYSKNIQAFLINNRLFEVHDLLNGSELTI